MKKEEKESMLNELKDLFNKERVKDFIQVEEQKPHKIQLKPFYIYGKNKKKTNK